MFDIERVHSGLIGHIHQDRQAHPGSVPFARLAMHAIDIDDAQR
jgi:hypothetical protein